MMNPYVASRLAARRAPVGLEALDRFVRLECGPRTSVDYLLAEMMPAAPGAPSSTRQAFREAVRAASRAVRNLVGGYRRAARDNKAASEPTD